MSRVLLAIAFLAGAFQSSNDYGDPKTWLCRPGRSDACAIDNTTTVVAADGKLTRETWSVDPNAPIDCFYVYPTVSTDQAPNSDMTADPAELNVIKQQFARLGSKCRPYAPLYRQVTLPALRAMITGKPMAGMNFALGYNDVVDAWKHYLENDNRGRGVVLIGHSGQGGEMFVQQADDLGRIHDLCQGSESANIAEEHADFSDFSSEGNFSVHELVRDFFIGHFVQHVPKFFALSEALSHLVERCAQASNFIAAAHSHFDPEIALLNLCRAPQ